MINHECDTNCGRVQLLCESVVNVKPSMTKIVGERFKVTVEDYTIYSGHVVVKGFVEKLTMYLHEHDHKKDKKDDCGKDGKKDGKKDGGKKGPGRDPEDCKTYLKKSFCEQVECVEGIVHYLESIMRFNAVVEIPGVKCGDCCKVTANVKDLSDFEAMEYDEKGHCTMGKENFILDVKVCCTDHKDAD